MIGKDYFKRQAATLRKMVRVTRNRTTANRLTLMADDFDSRSADEADESRPQADPSHEARGPEKLRD